MEWKFLKSESKSEPKPEPKPESRGKTKGLRKDQLLILLLFGVLLAVIAIPTEQKDREDREAESSGTQVGGSVGAGTEETEQSAAGEDAAASSDGSYEQRQERRLEEVLRLVEGVGDVEVMITLEAGSELVVEKDQPVTSQRVEETDSGGGSRMTEEENWSESTVYTEGEDGGRSPYVVKELEPKVQGVVVIAEGGGNPAVQQNILEAVQALFPVEAHKIKIMKMEGER